MNRSVDPVLDLPFMRQLVALARSHGYQVERNDAEVPLLGGGACIYDQHKICISSRFGELDALPVLIHEVAHGLLHTAAGRNDDERVAHEREANWVRETVLAALGLARLMPAERIHGGPPPSEEAEVAAKTIIAIMPMFVTHNLARDRRSNQVLAPASDSDDAVKQVLLDAALVLGFNVSWVHGAGIAGQHSTGTTPVVLSDELPPRAEVAVLAHELCHAIQHPPGYDYQPPR